MATKRNVGIHWFRRDLRLHDVPSLNEIITKCNVLYPIFIFDETVLDSDNVGYNRIRFICESLSDIDSQLKQHGARLFVFRGNPAEIFEQLFKKYAITHLSLEKDPLPVFEATRSSVYDLCSRFMVEVIEMVSHTLWDPADIIFQNGGYPPLTYELFCHIANVIGAPSRPQNQPLLSGVQFPIIEDVMYQTVPTPEDLNMHMECPEQKENIWFGGEMRAIKHLQIRLEAEEKAFLSGFYVPNQMRPDLLNEPLSMSAALSFGCLSVRKFYWCLHDLHKKVHPDREVPLGVTGQLIWREYFYTMSMNNPHYDSMLMNPLCLNIDWTKDDIKLQQWTDGLTGYPFIDAAMRQLKQEGWIHHVARNAVACFLTRGDLYISWEEGFKVFLKYLIDADWSVCAGNWMWVSSSAFENILQCSTCISPVLYGRRFDPTGKYIRKYVKELQKMPLKHLFDPWNAPLEVQIEAECIIGKDYPEPIVDHKKVCTENSERFRKLKEMLIEECVPPHCAPSNSLETLVFMWLPEKCIDNLKPCHM